VRLIIILNAVLISLFLLSSCKPEKKVMTLRDYAKIEEEVNLPDPELNPALVKKITKKYGFTFEEYKEFSQRVNNDIKLREKLGEIKLDESSGKIKVK
jgi:hypothetical protein